MVDSSQSCRIYIIKAAEETAKGRSFWSLKNNEEMCIIYTKYTPRFTLCIAVLWVLFLKSMDAFTLILCEVIFPLPEFCLLTSSHVEGSAARRQRCLFVWRVARISWEKSNVQSEQQKRIISPLLIRDLYQRRAQRSKAKPSVLHNTKTGSLVCEIW